ncbi:hypothetical protein PCK1_001708 [Pneumocystis canis]|nr:hypothetical protein PCK1_001708 [Pneumocystis canis]
MEENSYFSNKLLNKEEKESGIIKGNKGVLRKENMIYELNENFYDKFLEISDNESQEWSQNEDSDNSLIILTQEEIDLQSNHYMNKVYKDKDNTQKTEKQKSNQIEIDKNLNYKENLEDFQKASTSSINTTYNLNPYFGETYSQKKSDLSSFSQDTIVNVPLLNVYKDNNNLHMLNIPKYYQNPNNNVILVDDQKSIKDNFPMKYPDRPLPWKKPETLGTSANPIDLSLDSSEYSFSSKSFPSIHEYENLIPQKQNNISVYPEVLNTSREIMALLDNIQPVDEIKVTEGTPKRLLSTLMEHQRIGLTWMKEREEGSNKGGILADDMGLGKTIQALALIVSQQESESKVGPTLICTPVSLLQQWAREIQTKTKPPLKFYIYHGNSKRVIQSSDLNKYEIVLTTYGTIAHDYKNFVKYERNSAEHSKYMFYKPPFTLLDHQWHRVILDEAQVIKNRHTLSALSCCKLKATYRWCLSGTPMQNSIDELYSLMRFLRIKPYDNWSTFSDHFSRHFSKYSSSSNIKECMRKLQVLLKAILLRRTKSSTIDGNPILKLLPRNIDLVHVIFTDEELVFYKKLEAQSQLQMSQYVNENMSRSHYTNLLVLLLRLRQACDHPWLVKTEEPVKVSEIDSKSQEELVLEIFPQQVQNIRRLKSFECHVCYEVILSPNFIVPCGHHYCGDCIVKITEQNQKTAIMNGNIGSDARCPECRCLFNLKKVVDFSVFRKVYGWDYEPNFIKDEENKIFDEETDEDLTVVKNKEKGHSFDNNCTIDHSNTSLEWKKIFGYKFIKQAKNSFQEKLKNYENFKSSAKIDKCIEILDKIKHNNGLEKTIVFSQFVEFLDLLEIPLFLRGYKVLRYDGRMSAVHRDESLLKFDKDPTQTVMLISLKAGNAGLNLTVASQDLIENALEENASMQISRLNKQELSFLFGLQNE